MPDNKRDIISVIGDLAEEAVRTLITPSTSAPPSAPKDSAKARNERYLDHALSAARAELRSKDRIIAEVRAANERQAERMKALALEVGKLSSDLEAAKQAAFSYGSTAAHASLDRVEGLGGGDLAARVEALVRMYENATKSEPNSDHIFDADKTREMASLKLELVDLQQQQARDVATITDQARIITAKNEAIEKHQQTINKIEMLNPEERLDPDTGERFALKAVITERLTGKTLLKIVKVNDLDDVLQVEIGQWLDSWTPAPVE